MTTDHTIPRRPRPSLERRGIRLGDVLFRGVADRRRAGGDAAARPDRLQGRRAGVAGDRGVRAQLHLDGGLEPGHGRLRRARRSSTGRWSRRSIALLLATPLSIAIALFLTEIAPRRIAAPIATMVELLAAIPSVVLGLWGILVFGPWVAEHLEPWLESVARLPADLLGRPVTRRACCRRRSCSRS